MNSLRPSTRQTINWRNFDPVARTLLVASDGSLADRALVNPDRNNWAPRIGLAYSITDKTVLRAGYGTSYIHFNRLGGENLLSINLPFTIGVVINQTANQPLCTGNNFVNCFRPTQAGYPEGLISPERATTLTTQNQLSHRARRAPAMFKAGISRCSTNWQEDCCWTWLMSAITASNW